MKTETDKLIRESTEKIDKAFKGVMKAVRQADGCTTGDLASLQRADEFLAILRSTNERIASAKTNKERVAINREFLEKMRSRECAI